jgi:hypothetical protein
VDRGLDQFEFIEKVITLQSGIAINNFKAEGAQDSHDSINQ